MQMTFNRERSKVASKRKLSLWLSEPMVRRLFHERANQHRPICRIVEEVLEVHFRDSFADAGSPS